MKKLVIMVFSYDTASFPSTPAYRVVTGDGTWTTTAQGAHRATLVANLSSFLAERAIDVENVEQADGEGCFAMIMLARVRDDHSDLPALRADLQRQGQLWGASIRVQREDLFVAMHRI